MDKKFPIPSTIEDRVAFDMYFGGLCAFQQHPGAGAKDHKKITLLEARDIALEMLEIRKQTFKEQ